VNRCRLAAFGLGLLAVGGGGPLSAQEPLTLQQAIEMAQRQGFPARAAQATRDAARYRDRAFYSRLLPQLSLGGILPSYNRSIIPVVQPDGSTLFQPQNQINSSLSATMSQKLPLTGGDLFVTSSLTRLARTGESDFRTWNSTPISFGLRQEVLRPNALAWDKREEPLRSELAERSYLEAREDIALTTSNLFFDLYSARVALANQTKNAAVNDTLYTLNKGRFEVGKIGENDLLQSELALLRARTSLDGARLEHDRAAAALRLALNLPIGAPLEIAVTPVVPEFEADTAKAVSEALRNRASMSDLALQDVQARRRVTEARLSNWLGASISASYGFNATAPERDLVYSNLLEARQFALSVSLPLWQWGAHHEGVEAAKADRERVSSVAQTTVQQVTQDAHFAALQLSQARRNLALSAKADTVAGKRFEVALNRYVIGRIALDNLFVAQAEKDQALTQFVLSLRGYWQAYYRLRRLTLYDFAAGAAIH
jgi:outer membrane protein TolC